MAMPIHEARHNGQPGGVNHLGLGRYRDGSGRANRLEPAALDQDDRIFDRLPAGTVDQLAALNRQNLTRHFSILRPSSTTTNRSLSLVAAVSMFLEQWCFRERDGLSRRRR